MEVMTKGTTTLVIKNKGGDDQGAYHVGHHLPSRGAYHADDTT